MADSSKTPLLSKGKDGAGYGASLGHGARDGRLRFPACPAPQPLPCLCAGLRLCGCGGERLTRTLGRRGHVGRGALLPGRGEGCALQHPRGRAHRGGGHLPTGEVRQERAAPEGRQQAAQARHGVHPAHASHDLGRNLHRGAPLLHHAHTQPPCARPYVLLGVPPLLTACAPCKPYVGFTLPHTLPRRWRLACST